MSAGNRLYVDISKRSFDIDSTKTMLFHWRNIFEQSKLEAGNIKTTILLFRTTTTIFYKDCVEPPTSCSKQSFPLHLELLFKKKRKNKGRERERKETKKKI